VARQVEAKTITQTTIQKHAKSNANNKMKINQETPPNPKNKSQSMKIHNQIEKELMNIKYNPKENFIISAIVRK